MALTKKQEKELNGKIKKTIEEVRFQGLKAGAAGILGATLEMCNSGKTDADIVMNIKDFCEACDNIESLENKDIPEVLLVEDFDNELFINGKSVCCHENLYPYDVLKALDDYGIINFRHKE